MLVAGARGIDADPRRRFQPLGQEGALALIEQAKNLAFGDGNADRPELGNQARHGDLTLVILEQHETAQRRPEVPDHVGRHWPSGVRQRSRRMRTT